MVNASSVYNLVHYEAAKVATNRSDTYLFLEIFWYMSMKSSYNLFLIMESFWLHTFYNEDTLGHGYDYKYRPYSVLL